MNTVSVSVVMVFLKVALEAFALQNCKREGKGGGREEGKTVDKVFVFSMCFFLTTK